MGTETEEFRPRTYRAVEGFTVKPGEYKLVRVTRWADDGGGGVWWAVKHNGVIVGKLYRTKADAAGWAGKHALQPVFRVRCDEDRGRYVMVFGRERAWADNRETRAKLKAGGASVRVR